MKTAGDDSVVVSAKDRKLQRIYTDLNSSFERLQSTTQRIGDAISRAVGVEPPETERAPEEAFNESTTEGQLRIVARNIYATIQDLERHAERLDTFV